MTTNNDPNAIDKTWELTLYEQNRQPQPIITDNTEIGVSPRSLHSELMCPICLEILKRTMTTKECLHRFCHDCIITALRSGNKECPTCRKKLVSKRSLRFDPNFDAIISKIYPSREDYEAQQERVMEKLGKQHNFSANIEETLRRQAANRARSGKKLADNDEENALAAATASAAALTIHDENDVELVIKPLLHDKKLDRSLNTVRYLKITEQATVEHICKFLEMRYEFEHEGSSEEVKGSFDSISASEKQQQPRLLFHSSSLNLPSTSSTEGSAAASGDLFSSASTSKKTSYPFSIFIATGPSQFHPLPSDCSLTVVMDKYWKMDRPLELFFAYKMASTKKAETTPGASTKW